MSEINYVQELMALPPVRIRREPWPQLPPLVTCPTEDPWPCGRIAWMHGDGYRCQAGHTTPARWVFWREVAPKRKRALRRMMASAIEQTYGEFGVEARWLS